MILCGSEYEREFDYSEGSSKGPDHWGEFHEEWAICNKGDMQSPIDLSNRWVKVVPEVLRKPTKMQNKRRN